MENIQRIIVTNNPKVKELVAHIITAKDDSTELIDCTPREEVYRTVRDYIHKHWQLQNHAMYGNIQLYKQPYRSIILRRGFSLDIKALLLWEAAMEQSTRRQCPQYTNAVLEDFQEMDYILFAGNNPLLKL